MTTDARRHAEATERNREPILEVLTRHLRAGDRVLEIGAGSGQHAVWLAARLPVAWWLPTDPDPAARASIDAWRAFEGSSHVLPAVDLGVHHRPWPVEGADVVVAINLVHITPWSATEALLDGVAALGPRLLYLYGPYRREGRHTAPSNEAFDAWLKERDPSWGVRDLEAVVAAAEARGMALVEVVPMPANNLSVVLRVRGDSADPRSPA